METDITRQYNQYSDAVYRYIFLLVRQKETAEDLTQDTFYKAYRSMDSYRGEAAELTWLMRIARNVTYDYFRRKRIIAFFPFDDHKESRKSEESPEFLTLRQEETEELYATIGGLKRDYQDVLILRKIQEYPIKDTAFILNWTETKVKMKLSSALQALKKELERKGEIVDEPTGRPSHTSERCLYRLGIGSDQLHYKDRQP